MTCFHTRFSVSSLHSLFYNTALKDVQNCTELLSTSKKFLLFELLSNNFNKACMTLFIIMAQSSDCASQALSQISFVSVSGAGELG